MTTTTEIDIRDAPEGTVFTKDVVEAVQRVATEFAWWCGQDRRYLTAHTEIRFEADIFNPYTIASVTPEFVPVESVRNAMQAAIRGHGYSTVVKGVMAIADMLGIDMGVPNDKFVITVELSTLEIRASHPNFDPDTEDFDLNDWTSVVVDAIDGKLRDRDGWTSMNVPGVSARRIPDPARLNVD